MGRFLKTFGIYFIGNIASRLMSFLVMPIITSHVSSEDYGYFSTVDAMINIIVTIVFVQAWSGTLRYLFDYESRKMKRKVIATGYSIELISAVLFTVGFLIVNQISPIRDAWFVYFFAMSYMIHQNIAFTCRGLGYNKLYVWSGVLGSIVSLASNLILILQFHWGSNALILSMGLSYFVPAVFMEFFAKIRKNLKIRNWDKGIFKTMMRYCFPLSLNQGAYWINSRANVQIITMTLGLSATGIYTAASKFTNIIQLFVMVFNLAWQEFTFSISKDRDRSKKYNIVLEDFILFVSCGLLFLIPVTKIIFPILIKKDFVNGINIIPLAYLGTFMDSLANFLGSVMCAEKRMKSQLSSTVVGAVITVVFMFATIHTIGIQAASIAMILCFLAVVIIRTISLSSVVKLKYNFKYFIHYGLMFALTSYVFYRFDETVNALFTVIVALYCLVVLRHLLLDFLKMILKKTKG